MGLRALAANPFGGSSGAGGRRRDAFRSSPGEGTQPLRAPGAQVSRFIMACRPASLLSLLPAFVALAFVLGCGQSTTDKTAAVGPLPDDDALRAMLDEAIHFTGERVMNTRDHAAWQIVHGIEAYGRDLKIEHEGQVVPALEYLLGGGQLTGFNLQPGEYGVSAIVEPGSKTGQGHKDQWLGYMSFADVPPDALLMCQGSPYRFNDLVTQAQWEQRAGEEASWALMAYARYLPVDARWSARDGGAWTLERVIEMEASEDIAASACGGTHRLTGIAMMLNAYLAEGGELKGGWQKAYDVVQQHVQMARDFQQPDGSFSSNYFVRPGSTSSIDQWISTTGHTFEFLSYALTDEQLREPWMVRACVKLCKLLEQTRKVSVECGGLYHTAGGLIHYRQRLFGPRPSASAERPWAMFSETLDSQDAAPASGEAHETTAVTVREEAAPEESPLEGSNPAEIPALPKITLPGAEPPKPTFLDPQVAG